MSEPRTYWVGLPVGVTVYPDGHIDWEVDKSETVEGMEEHAPEEYTEEQIEADMKTVGTFLHQEYVQSRVMAAVADWTDREFELAFGFSRMER
jgi:hypothetical protein